MKNTITLLLTIFISVLSLSACEGPAGMEGLDGVDGTDGTNGTNGVNGKNGTDAAVEECILPITEGDWVFTYHEEWGNCGPLPLTIVEYPTTGIPVGCIETSGYYSEDECRLYGAMTCITNNFTMEVWIDSRGITEDLATGFYHIYTEFDDGSSCTSLYSVDIFRI